MSDPAEPRDDTDRYTFCPLCDQELNATDELAKSRDFAAGLSYAADEARERMATMAERVAALERAEAVHLDMIRDLTATAGSRRERIAALEAALEGERAEWGEIGKNYQLAYDDLNRRIATLEAALADLLIGAEQQSQSHVDVAAKVRAALAVS